MSKKDQKTMNLFDSLLYHTLKTRIQLYEKLGKKTMILFYKPHPLILKCIVKNGYTNRIFVEKNTFFTKIYW